MANSVHPFGLKLWSSAAHDGRRKKNYQEKQKRQILTKRLQFFAILCFPAGKCPQNRYFKEQLSWSTLVLSYLRKPNEGQVFN